MGSIYDIYGAEIKIGDIIAYSSYSREELRIAIVADIFDDLDYLKVFAVDLTNYYKVSSRVIKVKVDNVLRLQRSQVDPQVIKQLQLFKERYTRKKKVKAEAHARFLEHNSWRSGKVSSFRVVTLQADKWWLFSNTFTLKRHALAFSDKVDNTPMYICGFSKGELVRIYDTLGDLIKFDKKLFKAIEDQYIERVQGRNNGNEIIRRLF